MPSKRIPSLVSLSVIALVLAGGGAAYLIKRDRGHAASVVRADAELVVVPAKALDNGGFRAGVAALVHQLAGGSRRVTCAVERILADGWDVEIRIYQAGSLAGRGRVRDPSLCTAIKAALVAAAGRGDMGSARMVVDIIDRNISILVAGGVAIELIGDVVAVRTVDRALVRTRLEQGKEYLFRVIDRQWKGVHKVYDAPAGRLGSRLHTVQTASLLHTLLKLRAVDDDKRIEDSVRGSARFLLAMQSRERDRSSGGFYYSFDLATRKPEERLVVGTTARAIVALLELHAWSNDATYRDAAIKAADWLLTMLQPDGSVQSHIRRKERGWELSSKESLLYTGQVLSALSRMVEATGAEAYRDGAGRIATRLADKVDEMGCYLGDEYRAPNVVSSSGVALSLADHARATGDSRSGDTARRCMAALMERQTRDPDDIYEHGRWQGALSSSDIGWMSQVLSELYVRCRAGGDSGCDAYEQPILQSFRQLLQHTYTAETAFTARNTEFAHGGLFVSARDRTVRTDSVAQAMNAYINMVPLLGDGPLIAMPEPPLDARLGN